MKRTLSIILILCILFSLCVNFASAIGTIQEIRIFSIDPIFVGTPFNEISYTCDGHLAGYKIIGQNTQYYDGNQYRSIDTDTMFEFQYNTAYRWEMWAESTDEHLIFSLPACVHVPDGYTSSIESITSDGYLHFYINLGTPKVAPPSMFFNDVHTTDWFYHDVEYVYYEMMMNGVGNGDFDPYGTCTRAMVVTVLYRLINEPGGAVPCPFQDVPDGKWYTNAVKWAANCGVVKGISDTTFEPDAPVTREQFATILYRFVQEVLGESEPEGIMLIGFTDYDDISGWAGDALSWAFACDIIHGEDTNTGKYLYPLNNASRCEVAAILHRFCNTYTNIPG